MNYQKREYLRYKRRERKRKLRELIYSGLFIIGVFLFMYYGALLASKNYDEYHAARNEYLQEWKNGGI